MFKFLIVAIFCTAVVSAITGKATFKEWELYKKKFGKTYSTQEDVIRFKIFTENIEMIQNHNGLFAQKKVSFSMGINQFTDMTNYETNVLMNGFRNLNDTRTGSSFLFNDNIKLPSTVDWRTKGLVTGVKNQGSCGSCWAFSATGSLEGQHKLKTGNLVSLSEQNLVDCSLFQGDLGCLGGLMDRAFTYIKKNNGIDSEKSYPYTGAWFEFCHYKKSGKAATVTGFVDIPTGDENALKQAVATIGPISVAIDASSPAFHSYSSGIYDNINCSNTKLDHGVLAVGYGTENGKDYWLVKNSWGASWGLSGYLKMSRNKNNQCGIATRASYPLV